MCSISVAGQTGPLSAQPGYDYIAAAYAGVTGQIGEADGAPAQFTIAIGDCLDRRGGGDGRRLRAAASRAYRGGPVHRLLILDTYFHMHEVNVPAWRLRGRQVHTQARGSQHPDGGPTGLFRCRDGSTSTSPRCRTNGRRSRRRWASRSWWTIPASRTPAARRDNNDAIRRSDRANGSAGFRAATDALAALEQASRAVRAGAHPQRGHGAPAPARARNGAAGVGSADRRVRHPRAAGEVLALARAKPFSPPICSASTTKRCCESCRAFGCGRSPSSMPARCWCAIRCSTIRHRWRRARRPHDARGRSQSLDQGLHVRPVRNDRGHADRADRSGKALPGSQGVDRQAPAPSSPGGAGRISRIR